MFEEKAKEYREKVRLVELLSNFQARLSKSISKPKGTKAQLLLSQVVKDKLSGMNLEEEEKFKLKRFTNVPAKVSVKNLASPETAK